MAGTSGGLAPDGRGAYRPGHTCPVTSTVERRHGARAEPARGEASDGPEPLRGEVSDGAEPARDGLSDGPDRDGSWPPRPRPRDPVELLERLAGARGAGLVGLRVLPARSAVEVDWPTWVPPVVIARLAAAGTRRPWAHQVTAAEHAWAGRDVVVATGSGSGKSLAYLLPAIAAALDPDGATGAGAASTVLAETAGPDRAAAALADGAAAERDRRPDRLRAHPTRLQPLPARRVDRAGTLYLAPTKALAADQARAVAALGIPGLRVAVVDGDTSLPERDWARDHAHLVLTNPDMLHHVLLPDHDRWGAFWRSLRFVVLDECHAYRGLFGAHVAHLLRRARRVAEVHGGSPVTVLASATLATPASLAESMTGRPVEVVTTDAAPRGERVLALWEPPVDAAGHRRPAVSEAAGLLADLAAAGRQTVVFVRSRHAAEQVALGARDALARAGADPHAVAAYRAGYLPEDRRVLETALRERRVLGMAATNALELGVDVSGLDAVVTAGFPGTRASWWQQAGRTGRAGAPGIALFVARDDPLDTYLLRHPGALLDTGVEAAVLDPANPCVLAPQLCAAAAELPLREDELVRFRTGPAEESSAAVGRVRDELGGLVAAGLLRRRPAGWFWTRSGRAGDLADLRGSGGRPAAIVDAVSGRLLGTIDRASAPSQVHPGAVYLHAGRSWLVTAWRRDEDGYPTTVVCEPADVDWTTAARSHSTVDLLAVAAVAGLGSAQLSRGTVEVTSQVHSYVRRLTGSGRVLDETPLDCPRQRLRTSAVWWTLTDPALAAAGVGRTELAGALHAAEHAAIGLLPLFATCDRADLGGLSTAVHPDTGLATVIVHDAVEGGAGYATRGFEVAGTWWAATAAALAECGCLDGCPSCVQSPKCGSGNTPLSKSGAQRLLTALGPATPTGAPTGMVAET